MPDARRDFHRRLTAELLPYLSPQDHVCDAGCGLGFLSLALAPHVRHVTAADCDAQALSVLKEELAARHIENVTPLCTDIFTDRPAEPYDAMVFCFFWQHGRNTVRGQIPVPRHGHRRQARP